MRRWRLETVCLGSQLASFYHGCPLSPRKPPPPFSHTGLYVPEWFRRHDALVAGQDVVLFNDAERSRATLLAYFSLIYRVALQNTLLLCANAHSPARPFTHLESFMFLQNARARTLTLTLTSCTNTRPRAHIAVIKNETTGFLKAPRTEGESQQRSGEKSPPGNNEENDHLLFLKSR